MIERRVAELIVAHLCHELIGPVTAINNGFELVDAGAPVPEDVRELLVRSARSGAQRLRVFRIAYGYLADDATFGFEDARALLDEYVDGGKVAVKWVNGAKLGPVGARLLLNAAMLGVETLPRGGTVTADVRSGRTTEFAVQCAGQGVRMPEECVRALGEDADVAALTARSVHAYFASRLAQAHGGALRIDAAAGALQLIGTIPKGI